MKKIREDIVENESSLNDEYEDLPENLKEDLERFQDDKIGVIFHFGLYSIAGIVESWQLSKEDSWARKVPWRPNLSTLRRDYWNLNTQFHPDAENVRQWASLVKKSGIKYGILTTKHHDGFNIFDTKYSNYKSTNVKGGIDVYKEFSDSFRKQGLKIGAYYSKADWHCPYYWEPNSNPTGRYASYNPLKKPQLWNEFNGFVKNQLLEIASNYGSLDILWLDGGWVNKDNNEILDMDDIVSSIRKKQPDVLVVDRTIGGKYENYVTPERSIPEVAPKKVWESNIPLAKNWGYVPNDQYKSFQTILSMIIEIVSKGGNVILGVGPKPDGSIPKEAKTILGKLGNWTSMYGKAIYGSRKTHILNKQEGWYFTERKNHLYAIVKKNSFNVWDASELDGSILNVKSLNNQISVEFKNNEIRVLNNSTNDEFFAIDIELNDENR